MIFISPATLWTNYPLEVTLLQGCIGRKGHTLLQLQLIAALAVLGFLLGVVYLFVPLLGGILFICLAIAYPLTAAFWLPRWCQTARFHADENSLLLERGLFRHKTVFLSRSKIRYVTVTAAPLQRAFGIVSLRLMTAGGSVLLPQMELAQAAELAALLQLPLN